MANEVELGSLDLRYEGFRLKVPALEERLLSSILQRGIEQPLEGVDLPAAPAGSQPIKVLLNGFKRYRCARQLRLATVPFSSLGPDEATAILGLLKFSNSRSLSLLEQAAFIGELKHARGMNVAEIADALSRSKSWVTMRLGLLAEMSAKVREQLFAGAFPVYSYMYLRPFMRMNGVKTEAVEAFVLATSGRGLSVREVEQLAHAFFRGPDSFRQEILHGNLALPLERMRQAPPSPDAGSEFERILLGDLEQLAKYMQRVMGKSQQHDKLISRAFHAQSHLLTGGILSRSRAFFHTLRQLYDRNGQA